MMMNDASIETVEEYEDHKSWKMLVDIVEVKLLNPLTARGLGQRP